MNYSYINIYIYIHCISPINPNVNRSPSYVPLRGMAFAFSQRIAPSKSRTGIVFGRQDGPVRRLQLSYDPLQLEYNICIYIYIYIQFYKYTNVHTLHTLHYITLNYITLYITLHYITLHYHTLPLHLHYITLRSIHYIHYITLHYITYITLHYIHYIIITLHYITLHDITLHYHTLH